MSDLIPWYLVELRSRLSPYLEPKLVETIVGETKSHLNESVAKLESEQQIGEDQAIPVAIGAYGSPEKVALAHLKEHAPRPFGLKPIWLVVGGAFLSTTCWMLNWQWFRGYFDNLGETWENGAIMALCFLATVAFAIGCNAGRRRYRAVTLATCIGMMIGVPFVYSFLIVGSNPIKQGLNRLHLSRDVATLNKEVVWLNRLDNYAAAAPQIFANSKDIRSMPDEYTGSADASRELGEFGSADRAAQERIIIGPSIQPARLLGGPHSERSLYFIVPAESPLVWAMVDGRLNTGLQEEVDFAHAQYFWRTRGPEFRKHIADEKTHVFALLHSASEASRGRLFFFDTAKFDQQVTMWIPSYLIVLLIVEAGAFAKMRSRRRRPEFVKA